MSWKEPATATAAAAGQQAAPPTTSTPQQFSGREAWWWRLLAPIEWGLGVLPTQYQAPEAAVAKKTRRFNPGGWLISRWKKTAQFRSNMRWGSLSYIATTWEEEIASTDGCRTEADRAKAGSRGACDNDAGDGEDAMILAAFLRKRSSQCLIAGAVVTATVVYAMYRSRHKPRRPSPPRRFDGKKPSDTTTVATARKRWWQFTGRRGRAGTESEETGDEGAGGGVDENSDDGEGSVEDSNPELTQGFGGSETAQGDADRQETPRSSQSGGGGGGEDGDGRAKIGGQTKRDRKLGSPECRDPAPTAFPSPEHHREEDDGRPVAWDEPDAVQREDFAPALGKPKSAEEPRITSSGVEGKADVKDKRDAARTGSTGGKKRGDRSSVNNDSEAATVKLSRDISSLSESSTEDLLAEADSLIAAGARARKPSNTTRTALARPSKHRASGTANRMGSARATRTRSARGSSINSSVSSSKSRGAASSRSRSSQPRLAGESSGRSSDQRMPKRPRVYREVSAEEVDALVNLTHRALQLEPAALNEIAKDASRRKREDGELPASIGELGANASVVWNAGDQGGVSAGRDGDGPVVLPKKGGLWGGREEAVGNGPALWS